MIKSIISWLDKNLLAILAGFLLVFIPLYPKWPLFDILPGYNVRVRLEDFLVAFTIGVFLLQLVRRRLSVTKSPIQKSLVIYLIFGLLSALVAIFVIQTVPLRADHVGKTFLHWLRRVEYFSLFFVFFAAIKSARAVKTYLWLFFLTLLVVIIYGYGQKYLYWPAFSTMNREFAKGWWLYLSEHSRVLSTFGGHYDLAGYLVMALTLCWSFLFGLRSKLAKLGVGVLLAAGFWLLILTASRISFVGYLVGLTVVVFFWTFKKGVGWGISRWFIATFLSILIMLSFGDLSDRFLRLTRVTERFSGIRTILLRPAAAPPHSQAVFLENNLAAVTSRSDMPPSPIRPGDVTTNIPLFVTEKTASGSVTVERQRTYSANAVLFDLSTGIRLDSTWPQAIKSFLADPILGSGYATLNKASKYEFTDAESTDNDYLRSLGETGLLGFLAFFGTIIAMAVLAVKSLGGLTDKTLYALAAGFVGLVVGLLVNGTLIDIFEASKVAYVFWGVSGLTMGTLYLYREKIEEDRQPLRLEFSWSEFLTRIKKFLTSDLFWVSLILVLAVYFRSYKLDGPVADWHSWRQADTSGVTRDFLKKNNVNWLYPTYEDLSSVPSGKPNPNGYRFVEFPIYNAASAYLKRAVPELTIEEAGRVTTLFSSLLAIVFLFLLCRHMIGRRVAYLAALAYSIMPDSIYYGRTILPDPSMVGMSLGALWFGFKYGMSQKKRYFALSWLFATTALLIKPFAIFLLAPLVYIWFVSFGFRKTIILSTVYFLLSTLPFGLWRWWISHFPEGIPASAWLFNGNDIRFKGAFWYWLFADRVGRLILGYWGLVPLGFGLIRKTEGKFRLFPLLFLLSSVLYLFVLATGNVQHDYYQILLLPSLALFVSLGVDYLISLSWRGKILGVISVLFMLGFSWYFIRDYYNINHPEIVAAGKKFQDLTGEHEKALVIAPYSGDTAFLYQTGRHGWPIVEGSIDDMIKMGADYYVSVRFDDLTKSLIANSETKEDRETRMLKYPLYVPKKYTLLAYTDDYAIIQLVPDSKLPGN